MGKTLLMLTRYDRMGASSRVRALQYLPALQSAGITPHVLPFFGDAYLQAQYGGGRASRLRALKRYGRRLRDVLAHRRPDAIWLEYEMFPFLPFALEAGLLPRGVPLVADYDDAIFHRYDRHSNALVRRVLGRKIDRVMARADLVQAGNAYLAARAAAAGARRIEPLPTVVDMEVYGPRPARAEDAVTQHPVTLGWIGTPSTWDLFMAPMLPVLGQVQADHGGQFLAIGPGAHQQAGQPEWALFEDWSEAGEVPAIQRMDIGLMPLTDDPWARGKCGYKLIQYMGCGVPVVASPVGVNADIVTHGVTGFLATTPEEWTKALTTLMTDADLRARMGTAARERVARDYSLQTHAPRMVGWLSDLMGSG